MIKVYSITDIVMQPFDVLAEDSDHAAEMFIQALMRGLQNRPDCTFVTDEWTGRRLKRFYTLHEWATQGKTGIAWKVDHDANGYAWELTTYNYHRD